MAEATVHAMPLEEVAFHEVAAADSLGDMVGAAAAIRHLAPARVTCDAFGVCSGQVRMAHGVHLAPGPATGLILLGAPVVGLSGRMETVTPTGAAILVTVADSFGPPPAMTLVAQGHGLGRKDPAERANVLRAWLGETGRRQERLPTPQVVVLETNLDDATPQLVAWAVERCLEEGALDAWVTPVVMKKGRPGWTLHALVAEAQRDSVVTVLLEQTPAAGVRAVAADRTVAERRHVEVDTGAGRVRVKVASRSGRDLHATPELDDCVRLARASGLAPLAIQAEAQARYSAATQGAQVAPARRPARRSPRSGR